MPTLGALRQTGLRALGSAADRWAVQRLRRWPTLSATARRRLISNLRKGDSPRLNSVLTRLAHSRGARDRRLLAMIARATPAPDAIALLPRLLRDRDESVAREARRSLDLLVDASHCLRAAQRSALVRSLFHALAADDEPDSRRAIADWIVRAGPDAPRALRDALEDSDEAERMTIRAGLRRADSDAAAVSALRWLAFEPVQPTALARLAERFDPSLLAAAHLLRHPARSAAAVRSIDRGRPLRTTGPIAELPPRRRLAALRWRAFARPARSARTEEVRSALTDVSTDVRMLALANCMQANHQPEELADYVFDSSVQVARAAAVALDGQCAAHRAILNRLSRSEHVPCRAIAGAWRRASERESLIDWRRRLTECPDLAYAELRGALASKEASRRIHALSLIKRFELVDRFVDAILDAAVDPDARVAATAIQLVPRIDSQRARVVLGAAMAHADPRVRANALESVARAQPFAPIVQSAMQDDHARVRANAIRAFLQAEPAADPAQDALEAMLADDRPAHRLSALWVAERSACTEASESVAHIASREPDPVVRKRAQRAARRLLAQMSSESVGATA